MKKFIALGMAIVLCATTAFTVFGDPNQAGVAFIVDSGGTDIFDPDDPGEDPEVPGNPDLPPDIEEGLRNLSSMSIDFGNIDRMYAIIHGGTFPSISEGETNPEFQQVGRVPDGEFMGVGVANVHGNWQVQVAIGAFMGIESGEVGLQGAHVGFIPQPGTAVSTAGPLAFQANRVSLTAEGPGSIALSGPIGVFGINFAGELAFVANINVPADDLRAEVTWTFVPEGPAS